MANPVVSAERPLNGDSNDQLYHNSVSAINSSNPNYDTSDVQRSDEDTAAEPIILQQEQIEQMHAVPSLPEERKEDTLTDQQRHHSRPQEELPNANILVDTETSPSNDQLSLSGIQFEPHHELTEGLPSLVSNTGASFIQQRSD